MPTLSSSPLRTLTWNAGPALRKLRYKHQMLHHLVPPTFPPSDVARRLGVPALSRGIDLVGASLPVIQISLDGNLAHTREMVLRHAGFRVITQDAAVALSPALQVARCVTLLCQSLTPVEAAEASAHVHERHNCRVLRTTQTPEEEFGEFASMLEAPVHPLELVREILRMQLAAEDTPLGGYTS